jgi:pimeloyl-ACP methyl ester carboxylesterase
MSPAAWRDGYYSAQDGLKLHYRDYGDPLAGGTPVLCLAGLTRNARDFDGLARHLMAKRRVLVPDYRGRGGSAFDPKPEHYGPETALGDLLHLLTLAGCHRAAVVGTSFGGILAMALAAARPAALAGVVLNDVGPEVAYAGLDRIRGYVGSEAIPPDHAAGAAQLAEMMGSAYPDFTPDDWLAEARARYPADGQGRLGLEYDPAIAKPLAAGVRKPRDLWPLYGALAKLPVLAIRGALSDILDEATFERMAAEKPDLERLVVPDRGHVPLLTEPPCLAAIDAFLERIDRERH